MYQPLFKKISKSIVIGIALVILFVGQQAFAADTNPPTAPGGLQTINPTASGVTLVWGAALDTGVDASGIDGFNVYYGASVATPYVVNYIKANTGGLVQPTALNGGYYQLVVSNPIAGQSYNVAVEAVDNVGLVSSTRAYGLFVIQNSSNTYDPDCPTGNTYDPDCVSNTSSGGGYNFNVKFKNPLEGSGIDDIPTLLNKILDALMLFLVPIVVLFIIYAGFLFVMAQGNDVKLTKAKSVLGWTLVGAAILLGAKIITTVLSSTVTNILK